MDVVDANKTGVANEALNNIQRVRKAMTEQEARLVLGISEKSTWEEILQVFFFNKCLLKIVQLLQHWFKKLVIEPQVNHISLLIVQLSVNLVLIMLYSNQKLLVLYGTVLFYQITKYHVKHAYVKNEQYIFHSHTNVLGEKYYNSFILSKLVAKYARSSPNVFRSLNESVNWKMRSFYKNW